MPNKLDEAKRRVTYAEWTDIYALIKEIADAERLDVSDIVRKATQQ